MASDLIKKNSIFLSEVDQILLSHLFPISRISPLLNSEIVLLQHLAMYYVLPWILPHCIILAYLCLSSLFSQISGQQKYYILHDFP